VAVPEPVVEAVTSEPVMEVGIPDPAPTEILEPVEATAEPVEAVAPEPVATEILEPVTEISTELVAEAITPNNTQT
jgi:hypothetical protein